MFDYGKFETLCTERGITPYAVGKQTGIATSTLTEWKNYCNNPAHGYCPKADKILKIAALFGVSIEYFLKE